MSTPQGTIHVRRSAGPGSDWQARTGDGTERRGRLDEICAPAEAVVLLAPGPDVRLLSVQLPGVKVAQAAAAIPFALEDRLAADVETLAVAAGRPVEASTYPVAVVARRRLAGWVAAVTRAGAKAVAIVPECACLPWAPGELSVLLDGEMAHVRYGTNRAFSVEAELLPQVLLGLSGEPAREQVRLFLAQGAEPASELRAALAAIAPVAVQPVPSVLGWLAGAVNGAMALDLVRAGRPAVRSGGSLLQTWRVPTTVLVLLGVLVAAGVVLESASLERQLSDWDARTRTLYREAFPEARRVDDVQRLIQQRLAARASTPETGTLGQFLALLGAAATPLASSDGVLLTAISYRPGRLDLDLSAPELADFETYRKAVSEQDPAVRAELTSAVATPDGATARVRLGEAMMPPRTTVLTGLMVIAVLAGLWEWGWRPLLGERDRLRAQVADAAALHRWAAATLPTLTGAAAVQSASTSAAEAPRVIQQTVQRFGFGASVTRIEPRDERILVSLEEAPFDRLAAWLATLQDEAGLAVVAAELSRAPRSGTVSGRLELRGRRP